jgi:peroxiredoxin
MEHTTARPAPLRARLALVAAILLAAFAGWLFAEGGLLKLVNALGDPGAPGDVGQPAPQFELEDTSGRVVRLADLRGKVVLVNFWATWCAPCRTEMPEMEKVYREHRERGFEVVAIDLQESAAEVRPFMAELGLTYPALLDRDGSVSRAYRARALPSSFLVDRQGTVRYLKIGPLTTEALEAEVRKLL